MYKIIKRNFNQKGNTPRAQGVITGCAIELAKEVDFSFKLFKAKVLTLICKNHQPTTTLSINTAMPANIRGVALQLSNSKPTTVYP